MDIKTLVSNNLTNQKAKFTQYKNFLQANVAVLLAYPELTFQQAFNDSQPEVSQQAATILQKVTVAT